MLNIPKTLVVKFYQSITKKEPVREWLLELEPNDCKTIGTDIKTIEYSWSIGMPICKPLGKGMYEVRSNLTDGKIGRVIFCIVGNKMILLHGFIKKTQKISDKELDLAYKRKKEVEL